MPVTDTPAVTLSLFRMRAARFTDDLPTTALAELLDERLVAGRPPRPDTLDAVTAFLDAVRSGAPPELPVDPHLLADREGLDLAAALADRHAHTAASICDRRPELAVFIVGAPRSGTSHLFNLLATHPGLAHLTNVSCWAWPTFGLATTGKRPCPPDLAAASDSKQLKVDPIWRLPAEGEDVLNRTVPAYAHLRRHTYRLQPAAVTDPALLHRAVGAHLIHLDARWFLAKSPFNTFRIPQLAALFGAAARFVHLHRDGYQSAASIAANRFEYQQPGSPGTPIGAWIAHVRAAVEHSEDVPMLHVAYERLASAPVATLRWITDWLAVPAWPIAAPPRTAPQPRPAGPRDAVVEELHARLATLNADPPPARRSAAPPSRKDREHDRHRHQPAARGQARP